MQGRRFSRFACMCALAGIALPVAGHAEDWLTFGKTMARAGYNGQEFVLNEATVPGLHQLWAFPMFGPILAQPLLAGGIPVDDGTGTGNTVPVDLIYVADLTGAVAALDAGGGGAVWAQQLPALSTPCTDFPKGTVGIVGTPTIDKPNNRMWIMAADGTVWALALDTGQTLPGYPVQAIDPDNQNGVTVNYGALSYDDNGSLYVTTAGQCEQTPYIGQAIKIVVGGGADDPATTAPQVAARFIPTGGTGAYGGGIWGFGGVSLDGTGVYAAVGNAQTVPENIGYAEAVVKLDSNLNVVASNSPALGGADVDFGATPMLYQPPNCPPQMAVMNKTGELFVYNRGNAADISFGPLQRIGITQTADVGGFIGLPAYDPVSQQLYLGNPKDDQFGQYRHGLLAFAVGPNCLLSLRWQQTIGFDSSQVVENPVIPPTVANGVVYFSTGSASQVYAYGSGGNLLWNSGTQITGGIFTPPTVINGMLLVADYNGTLTAFGP